MLLLSLVLLSFPSAQARFRQPSSEYQARRAKLRSLVNNPIVIYGYSGHENASEVAVFFQETYFYYLTGHDEPGAALLIVPDASNSKPSPAPREILYLPPRDLAQEKWDGPKLGPADPGIAEQTGFQAVEPIANLQDDLRNLAKIYPKFSTLLPPPREEGYPHFGISVGMIRTAVPREQLVDVTPQIDAMRQLKSPGELALIQKAIDVSVDAHLDAMKTMRPGSFEYQVAARMQEIHETGGCSAGSL